MRREAGVTLIEVLIAVALLSVLSVGMMLAMRIGITALGRTDKHLMDNRRVAGAQRIVEQELGGLIPATAPCMGGGGGEGAPRVLLFSGQSNTLTLVSAFSLQQAWRGRPQVLQLFTAPSEEGGGMRLLVNEIPYTGSKFGGQICSAVEGDPETGGSAGRFPPPAAGNNSFVLADRLRRVSFQYLKRADKPEEAGTWLSKWTRADLPAGIRVLIEPLEPTPARLQPVTITVPVYVYRTPGVEYADR